MNVFEVVYWTVALWLVCWLTIMLTEWTGMHLGLVSFGMVLVLVGACAISQRLRIRSKG